MGFIAVDKAGGQLFFQLTSDLYELVSLIIASNLRFDEWNCIFADSTFTTEFFDRLTPKGQVVEFRGEPHRYRHRLRQEGA